VPEKYAPPSYDGGLPAFGSPRKTTTPGAPQSPDQGLTLGKRRYETVKVAVTGNRNSRQHKEMGRFPPIVQRSNFC